MTNVSTEIAPGDTTMLLSIASFPDCVMQLADDDTDDKLFESASEFGIAKKFTMTRSMVMNARESH